MSPISGELKRRGIGLGKKYVIQVTGTHNINITDFSNKHHVIDIIAKYLIKSWEIDRKKHNMLDKFPSHTLSLIML